MKHNIDLPNSEIERRINEQIHSERNRRILKMRLVDGMTYERIAEAVEMSPRYIRSLIRKLSNILNIA
ncbi:MAG: hypothetical protein J6P20_10415 [Oscillospiraceae bacterium]|nr:hypothetical protein [Oscillospiraceae bacterium]